jgi:hypothetical protein
LPSHERVVTAWIDAVGGADGTMQRCDPSGAFFVDGYHGVAFTKRYRLEEKGSRSLIARATHLPLLPVLALMPLSTLRDPGRRPAGDAVASPPSCAEPDRDAIPSVALSVPFVDRVDGEAKPSVVVDVSPIGTVMFVDVVTSAGSRKADDAMIGAALSNNFVPARWRCMSVPDRLILPVTFMSAVPSQGDVAR